jgi:serine/threonine protein kinase
LLANLFARKGQSFQQRRKVRGVYVTFFLFQLQTNIVSILEAFDEADVACLVMEFLGGGDLKKRYVDPVLYGLNDELTVKVIAWQIAAAVGHVHSKNCVHRDLKVQLGVVFRKSFPS